MASLDDNKVQVGKLLEDIDIAMLTTVGDGGYLVSRPMSTQQAEFDGERLWFFIEADSPKVAEIRRHRRVNLAYASKEKNTYVSVAGEASIGRDEARIDELWNDGYKAYFPQGKNDPNLTLLEVTVHTVEYWDGPSTRIGRMVTFVIARVTKNEEVMGENRIVDLTGSRAVSRLPPTHARAKRAAKKGAKRAPARKAPGSSSTAKKTAAKKSAARKAPRKGAAKTAGVRKQPARKAAAKRATKPPSRARR